MPSLAIPTNAKGEFACPNSHITVLDNLMQHVDAIVSIGWKGAEPHFLERLARATDGRRPRLLAINRTLKSRNTLVERLGVAGVDVERASIDATRDTRRSLT